MKRRLSGEIKQKWALRRGMARRNRIWRGGTGSAEQGPWCSSRIRTNWTARSGTAQIPLIDQQAHQIDRLDQFRLPVKMLAPLLVAKGTSDNGAPFEIKVVLFLYFCIFRLFLDRKCPICGFSLAHSWLCPLPGRRVHSSRFRRCTHC